MANRDNIFREQCIGNTPEVALCYRLQAEVPACENCKLLTKCDCFCTQPVTKAELKAKKCKGFKSKYEEDNK